MYPFRARLGEDLSDFHDRHEHHGDRLDNSDEYATSYQWNPQEQPRVPLWRQHHFRDTAAELRPPQASFTSRHGGSGRARVVRWVVLLAAVAGLGFLALNNAAVALRERGGPGGPHTRRHAASGSRGPPLEGSVAGHPAGSWPNKAPTKSASLAEITWRSGAIGTSMAAAGRVGRGRAPVAGAKGQAREQGEGQAGSGAGPDTGERDEAEDNEAPTSLEHISFNIASSALTWQERSPFVRAWWQPGVTRGRVWLDSLSVPVSPGRDPPVALSSGTAHLQYRGTGLPTFLRMARIVVDAVRREAEEVEVEGRPRVRWYVCGDDDSFFSPRAFAAVLSQLDHRVPLYLGANSETHFQNIIISHGMAFGGGGYAVSAALAADLNRSMDACLPKYEHLFGSDQRVHACAAELGVSLTPLSGFHQCDLWGSLRGLLMAHPPQPLLSLHHLAGLGSVMLDAGITNRATALATMARFIEPDPVGFAQLAVCYDRQGTAWSAAVSWGVGIKFYPGVVPILELMRAERTFHSFVGSADPTAFTFDTRAVQDDAPATDRCNLPFSLHATSVEARRDGSVESFYRRTTFARPLNRSMCPFFISKVVTATVKRPAPRQLVLSGTKWSGPNLIREACSSVSFQNVNGELHMTVHLQAQTFAY